MRFFVFVFLLCLQVVSAGAREFSLDASGLPPRYREAVGKTFEVMGPNCFGTVLKLSGFQSTFRGVDVGEFQAFVKLACRQVESPEPGDIGVFEAPGFAPLHAYIYLSRDLGIEKPGVDYMGKTPIALNSLASIMYRSLASPECRRYSRDVDECSNRHYYVRCSPPPPQSNPWFRNHQQKVLILESIMGSLLGVSSFNDSQIQTVREMQIAVEALRADLRKAPVEGLSVEWQDYLKGRVRSLEKQFKYFQVGAGLD